MPRHRQKKESKKFPLFDKIILGLNIVAVICLLLSYMAPSTNPREFWVIAIMGLAYPFILLANAVFVVYWVIRWSPLTLISLFSILAGYSFILDNYGLNKPELVKKDLNSDLRVVQYNVHNFEGVDKFQNEPILSNVATLLTNESPDIVCLEDYKVSKLKSPDVSKTLMSALKMGYYCFKPFRIGKLDSAGNAIYSKFPIIACDTVPLSEVVDTRAIYADIRFHSDTIRVYTIHLQSVSFKGEDHRALKGNAGISKTSRIGGKLKYAFIKRSYQVSKLRDHIENCKYPYLIVGDFNDTPNSFAYNELKGDAKSTFKEKGRGFGYTYFNDFPNVQIDHILASGKFKVLTHRVVETKLSDHYPVVSDLRLQSSRK